MTYGQLKADILTRLNRSNEAENVGGWVKIAQQEMNTTLRHPDMNTYLTLTLVDGQVALPDRYLAMENIEVRGAGKGFLQYVPPNTFDGLAAASTSPAIGSYYTIQGRQLITYPSLLGEVIETRMRFSLEPFTQDSDTDWVLTQYGHAYLYGALAQGYAHIHEFQTAKEYRNQFLRALGMINTQGIEQGDVLDQAVIPSAGVV